MFPLAFGLGAVAGYLLGQGPVPAIVGGLLGVGLAFVGQAALGLYYQRRARAQVPVDLAAPVPQELTALSYRALPPAARNACIVRAVSNTTGIHQDVIAGALPDLMGRSRMSSVRSQQVIGSLYEDLNGGRIDHDTYQAILEGEMVLATQAVMPSNDHVRAIAERNFGTAITPEVIRNALATTRFPLLGRATLAELAGSAMAGETDLAFVVGLVRKTGETHAKTIAELR